MYRILLLVTLTVVVNSLECLHHSCSAALKACDINHDTWECRNWADETFHCCGDCESCGTPKGTENELSKNVNWEHECHPHLCDAVFDVCNRMHPNSTECIPKADKVSHCCYYCLDCPSAERAQFSKHTSFERQEKNERHHECDADLCNAVYEECKASNHNHSSHFCQHIADVASDCSGKCKDNSLADTPKPKDCHAKLCTAVLDHCTHSNATDCQYRADEASNCCYNCLDCPTGVETPTRPKYDHCLSNLCDGVFELCVKSEHDPSECRAKADKASDCCNMCDDCH